MPKHKHKHALHKAAVHRKKPKFSAWIIISVLIIAILAYAFTRPEVAARVNNKPIYAESVEALYNALPKASSLTRQQILQRLIDTKVIVNYAENKGYGLTDEQFNQRLNMRLTATGTTLSEYKKQLALWSETLNDLRDSFVLEDFVNSEVIPLIKVDETAISNYRILHPRADMTDAEIINAITKDVQSQFVSQLISTHSSNVDIEILKIY